MIAILATLVVVFALDRIAKAIAMRRPGLGRTRSLAGLVTIRPMRNPRPAHWPGASPIGWALAYAAALVAALWLVRIEPFGGTLTRVGLGVALGGALGNLYDRVRHGAVLDFLCLGRGGVFNPADAALVAGIAAVLVSPFVAANSGSLASLFPGHG